MLPRTASSKQLFVDAAEHLVSQGVKAVATTLNDKETNTSLSLYVKEVNQTLKDNNIPLTIVEGTGVVAYHMFAESYQRCDAMLASNEKYIVLTIPKQEEADYLKQLVYEIQLNKIVPIISEPDLNVTHTF
jgi:protein-tyrosine phosphatase